MRSGSLYSPSSTSSVAKRKAKLQMATTDLRAEEPTATPLTVTLPAPTAWPIILAFGITLIFAGLLTSASVSILGAIFFVTACVGWFRDVLPHEKEETVQVREEVPVIS